MTRKPLVAPFLLCAALLCTTPFAAQAADTCSAELSGNDAMKFDKANIDVPKSCKTFTINLKHSGKLAKNVMGHNVVVTKAADVSAVANDGIKAGPAGDYVKADDARVVAHSALIGGGETTSVSIPVAKLTAGPYVYVCTFPGHWALMKGTLTLK